MPLPGVFVLAAVFGLAAVLVVLGILASDLVSLGIGALLFALGARLRKQAQAQRARAQRGPTEATADEEAGDATAESHGDGDGDGDAAEAFVLADAEPVTSVSEEGTPLHGLGYCLQQPETGEAVDADALDLTRDDVQAVSVVTPPEHHEELQVDDFAPGQPVALVPQRVAEEGDRVRVFDDTIDHLAGWLADDAAQQLGPLLRRGTKLRAMSFYEWRDEQGGRRELRVLVYRPTALVDE